MKRSVHHLFVNKMEGVYQNLLLVCHLHYFYYCYYYNYNKMYSLTLKLLTVT